MRGTSAEPLAVRLADEIALGLKNKSGGPTAVWRALRGIDSAQCWTDLVVSFQERHPQQHNGNLRTAIQNWVLSNAELSKVKLILRNRGAEWEDCIAEEEAKAATSEAIAKHKRRCSCSEALAIMEELDDLIQEG
eukprot:Hpha_TRINITY_DN9683_c0_g2::TRINITY_DN9683_c0_g2_i1::g.184425::m.184425